jgi:uncharacterized protein (TIGR00369 family)
VGARTLTGLEVIEALRDGRIPPPGVAVLLGMDVTEVEEGRVVFALDPGPQHGNPIGTTHGGILATLLDSCVGCAVHTTLGAGDTYTTLELKVNYLRPVMADAGRITAEGTVLHVGGRVALAEGRLLGPDGRLAAHATTTCLITRGG